ncbi:1-phosphofructokinase family hexose kinase [Tomitella gaofuii]|uniref:1-phosphofructokinase family hexose kinase n=1 Tax=Tomitella gaofuii TaxID=2760083 RepID=UPI0015FBDBB0|nr:1-phosphofructokinase family hexose kinase [Tomitella gaofuii]
MIVTLTANPSIDRTVALPGVLERGGVLRSGGETAQPGGKGVNVSRVLMLAGARTRAVLPVDAGDPLATALAATGLDVAAIPRGAPTRTNLTLTEPDGTTTKINSPGTALAHAVRDRLVDELVAAAADAQWAVLSGSLPAEAPDDWYADVLAALRSTGARIAVDTSDRPLRGLAARFPAAAPDLIKPNSEELAQLTGERPDRFDAAAAAGDPGPVVAATRRLLDRGVGAVLVTLGSAGALLVDPQGAWWGAAPPVRAHSTVGAGDSSLAGYLLADTEGLGPAERLRGAIAYGAAAVSLPGTTPPAPEAAAALRDRIPITELAPHAAPLLHDHE